MKLAKRAVAYYVDVTGNPWSKFYDDLDEVISKDFSELHGDKWLLKKLIEIININGVSINEFKVNKDMIKSVFDNEGRKLAGEFFTPILWAEELHRYMDKYISDWRNKYNVWEISAGSGNLIRTANIKSEHLYASTLQEDDVVLLKNTPELQGSHIFQLDFLNSVPAWNDSYTFESSLPDDIKSVLKNNEPIIFLANPPYKTGQASATKVGEYMCGGENVDYDNTDFSKPAYDLFYQFCFQVMNLVNFYKLTDAYFCFFGPLTFFTGAGAGVLLNRFEHVFEYIDGMCISAQEFSDTSESILWGIGASIWKSRGEYLTDDEGKALGINFHKDILLDKKFITPDGKVGCEGKVLYEQPRMKLSDWVKPNDAEDSVYAPVLTSHLTFKGGQVFEKVGHVTGKLASNALGTLMVGNTLTRSADQSAILSMPTTIQFEPITKENFWRCVGSYAFRRTIDAGWSIAKKEISAPNDQIEGYDVWLRNAIVSFLFEYKSMMSSMRDVQFDGNPHYSFNNKLFYLTEAQIRQHCNDEVILEDLEKFPLQNEFMLQIIEESRPYWVPEVEQLFNWCRDYTLATYNYRKTINYKGSLDCADAGFQQIRSALWDANKLDADLTKLLVQVREYLRKDIWKFGFVSEVVASDI